MHCHTLDTVNPAMGMMLCSSMLAFEKVYYYILCVTNNVEIGDFHRSSTLWMIFQCKLMYPVQAKTRQSCHYRTIRNIVNLCPNSTFVDFVGVFSFFVKILMIALYN